MDQAYQEKLDGKISEEFWARKSAEWHAEEGRTLASIEALKGAQPERLLDAARILELANKAYFLQSLAVKAKLLKIVLSNCSIDAVSLHPTYRKPFDLIFKRTKTEGWLPRWARDQPWRRRTRGVGSCSREFSSLACSCPSNCAERTEHCGISPI
jgi:hypothetical protein